MAKVTRSRGEERAGSRILVVDDAESIRTYLANFLQLKGYDVDTAEDGRSALALLEGGAAPDVVLLDIMMPGIDGIETLAQIRERHADLPVVMLSVVGRAATIVRAMQLGASDFLNKPFEEEELEEVLNRVLSGPEAPPAEADDGDVMTSTVWDGPAMKKIPFIR